MIGAANAENGAGIMGEGIGQTVNQVCVWQANAKVATGRGAIAQRAPNLIERAFRHVRIHMQEPKELFGRSPPTGIQLASTPTFDAHELIAEGPGKLAGSITTAAIDHNDFCARCALAQMKEKAPDERLLVQHRNNDGNAGAVSKSANSS